MKKDKKSKEMDGKELDEVSGGRILEIEHLEITASKQIKAQKDLTVNNTVVQKSVKPVDKGVRVNKGFH